MIVCPAIANASVDVCMLASFFLNLEQICAPADDLPALIPTHQGLSRFLLHQVVLFSCSNFHNQRLFSLQVTFVLPFLNCLIRFPISIFSSAGSLPFLTMVFLF